MGEPNRMILHLYRNDADGVAQTTARWNPRDDLGEWMRALVMIIRNRYGDTLIPHRAVVVDRHGRILDSWDRTARTA